MSSQLLKLCILVMNLHIIYVINISHVCNTFYHHSHQRHHDDDNDGSCIS